MAVLSVQDEFQSGDNVTALSLNNLVNQANFTTDTTDNSTLEVHSAGYLKVKDDGIQAQHLKSDPNDANDNQRAVTTNHIRNDNVTTAKIADDNVTFAKIEEMPARTVIGNNTDATANPTAVLIDDLKDSISNTTPHDSDTDSDGINDTGGVDGLMSAEDKTKLDGVATGATANTGTVTSVSGGTGITGTVTTSGSLSLSNSGVSAGNYTNDTVTVDSKGRVTSASTGSSGLSIKAFGTLTSGGGTTVVLSNNSGCSISNINSITLRLTVSSGVINGIVFSDMGYSSNTTISLSSTASFGSSYVDLDKASLSGNNWRICFIVT
jgi:hypothetical protein